MTKITKAVIFLVLMIILTSSVYAEKMKVEKERFEFNKLLSINPNYFGTFPEFEMQPVNAFNTNTKYEEVGCIGFIPEQDVLKAVIDVKKTYGYSGSLCLDGSYEYVRFFADWNGDGDYLDDDEDLGVTGVNVHDIPDGPETCLSNYKPLSYTVSLEINPDKKWCFIENLVKIKAILSWNTIPQEGNPNYTPVWGNSVEGWIQIEPKYLIFVPYDTLFITNKYKYYDSLFAMYKKVSSTISLKKGEKLELKKKMAVKDLPQLRYNVCKLEKLATAIKLDPNYKVQLLKDTKMVQLLKDVDILLALIYDTSYEQLTCLGLEYDLNYLTTTLTIKKPYGYSGDLCDDGSHEFVAFWAYVEDAVTSSCSWRYMGTSSVGVHDINSIPSEGLQYAVTLPADFSDLWRECDDPQVLKVRAVLSWNTPPSTTDPYEKPRWGNAIEAKIQLKPNIMVLPDEQIPYISIVGGMSVTSISSNGYANGLAVNNGWSALDSPFGQKVRVSGYISNPPDISAGATKLKYKIQYSKSGNPWRDITTNYTIWVDTYNGGWSTSHWTQKADVDGYYTYEMDLSGSGKDDIIYMIADNMLTNWKSTGADGDGLYTLRMIIKDPDNPSTVFPASNEVKVRIDNTAPMASIDIDAGACSDISKGDNVTGTFKATDDHIRLYDIYWEPYGSTGSVTHTPAFTTYPALGPYDANSGTFTLSTSGMVACGYVLKIKVWDRTIINNSYHGNRTYKNVGMCLRE